MLCRKQFILLKKLNQNENAAKHIKNLKDIKTKKSNLVEINLTKILEIIQLDCSFEGFYSFFSKNQGKCRGVVP